MGSKGLAPGELQGKTPRKQTHQRNNSADAATTGQESSPLLSAKHLICVAATTGAPLVCKAICAQNASRYISLTQLNLACSRGCREQTHATAQRQPIRVSRFPGSARCLQAAAPLRESWRASASGQRHGNGQNSASRRSHGFLGLGIDFRTLQQSLGDVEAVACPSQFENLQAASRVQMCRRFVAVRQL